MSKKINFTQEHRQRLFSLALSMLFDGNIINGLVGTKINIHDLIHNTSIATLSTINGNLKKEIEKIESLDEWSQTEYQQRKLAVTKETQELVNLLIGYKRYNDQLNSDKEKISELKADYEKIKSSNLSPEEQLKSIAEKIKELGGDVVEEVATTNGPISQP